MSMVFLCGELCDTKCGAKTMCVCVTKTLCVCEMGVRKSLNMN